MTNGIRHNEEISFEKEIKPHPAIRKSAEGAGKTECRTDIIYEYLDGYHNPWWESMDLFL